MRLATSVLLAFVCCIGFLGGLLTSRYMPILSLLESANRIGFDEGVKPSGEIYEIENRTLVAQVVTSSLPSNITDYENSASVSANVATNQSKIDQDQHLADLCVAITTRTKINDPQKRLAIQNTAMMYGALRPRVLAFLIFAERIQTLHGGLGMF